MGEREKERGHSTFSPISRMSPFFALFSPPFFAGVFGDPMVLAVTRTRGGGRIRNVAFIVRALCEPYHRPSAYRTPSDRGCKGPGGCGKVTPKTFDNLVVCPY